MSQGPTITYWQCNPYHEVDMDCNCQLTMESRKAEHCDGPGNHLYCSDRDGTADKTQLQCMITFIVTTSITAWVKNCPVLQTLQKTPPTVTLQFSKVLIHYNTYFGHSRNLQNSVESRPSKRFMKADTQKPGQQRIHPRNHKQNSASKDQNT